MISKNLLTSKGAIDALLLLYSDQQETYDIDTVTESMDIATTTARDRLEQMQECGLVEQGAELVDGRPKRVFSLTDDGDRVAENLQSILSDSIE